ncbi:hypothetical protein [uncultured Draconibacterium sp.]|uniref:hypothetical protein n=1 Tax=uncultured Draconibacterium sp. TaxID=1573823 RepID=UPI002AA809B7|nr:hypothetical protein [uncultured Draconibacterium sp.]
MEHLDIILPGLLVLIAFLLKLLIDEIVDITSTIQALIELPVDVIFLALTFSVAFTLTNVENQLQGLFYGFLGFVISIIVILLWKKTKKLFLIGNKWWIFLVLLNLSITGLTVVKAVNLVISCEM